MTLDDDVEGAVQRAGHLVGDRHPAPWQPEHDRGRTAMPIEKSGETASRVASVEIPHLVHERTVGTAHRRASDVGTGET